MRTMIRIAPALALFGSLWGALIVGVTTAQAAQAAQAAGPRKAHIVRPPAPVLGAADYAAIYQLYARYAYSIDKVLEDGRMWANLFTTDGVFVDIDGTTVAGRDKLATYAWEKGTRSSFRWITYLGNPVIEPSPEGVTVTAYYLTMNVHGQQPTSLVPGGIFFDVIVKTREGWRFKQKTLVAPDAPMPARPTPAALSQEPVHERAAKKPTSTLTAQDYVDIEQLYARFGHGMDNGTDNGYLLADAFTADGFFASTGPALVEGRTHLAELSVLNSGGRGPYNTRHWTWNVMAEPAPWGAIGRAYIEVTIAAAQGQPSTIGHGGAYLDTLVKTADGWRFKNRHPIADWR